MTNRIAQLFTWWNFQVRLIFNNSSINKTHLSGPSLIKFLANLYSLLFSKFLSPNASYVIGIGACPCTVASKLFDLLDKIWFLFIWIASLTSETPWTSSFLKSATGSLFNPTYVDVAVYSCLCVPWWDFDYFDIIYCRANVWQPIKVGQLWVSWKDWARFFL